MRLHDPIPNAMGQVRLHDLHAKHTELLLGVHPHGGREDMAFKVTFLPEHRHAFVCTYQVRLRARARARLRVRVRVRVRCPRTATLHLPGAAGYPRHDAVG